MPYEVSVVLVDGTLAKMRKQTGRTGSRERERGQDGGATAPRVALSAQQEEWNWAESSLHALETLPAPDANADLKRGRPFSTFEGTSRLQAAWSQPGRILEGVGASGRGLGFLDTEF
jgi:hypothetical protein